MPGKQNQKEASRLKRKLRIRKKVSGSTERPRLTVFRSDKHIYAQIIDDISGTTLVSASTLSPEYRDMEKPEGKIGAAKRVGEMIARRAQEKGISKVVFDRNGFIYHGRIQALANAAREAGLDF
ncbi:MAG: 50S ribosomal protein L18 [Syntrophobacteraceae bacterium]|nr:50S ribosomal protein L18 [Desulfobacteraceae bacterium]